MLSVIVVKLGQILEIKTCWIQSATLICLFSDSEHICFKHIKDPGSPAVNVPEYYMPVADPGISNGGGGGPGAVEILVLGIVWMPLHTYLIFF